VKSLATRWTRQIRAAAADCINRAIEKSDIAEICHVIGAATRLLAEEPAALGSRPPVIRRADLGDKEILLAGRPDYRVALLRSGQPVLCLYFQVSSDQHPQINEQTAPGLSPGRREVER
jgi:hypothetical protein